MYKTKVLYQSVRASVIMMMMMMMIFMTRIVTCKGWISIVNETSFLYRMKLVKKSTCINARKTKETAKRNAFCYASYFDKRKKIKVFTTDTTTTTTSLA